jgi:Phage integrase family
MASTYLRPDSSYIWIRFKDSSGRWRSANTGYRKNSGAESRQANILAKEKSLQEITSRGIAPGKAAFADWCSVWVAQRWSHKSGTLRRYRIILKKWLRYLAEVDLAIPAMVTRETVLDYVAKREAEGAARNTALSEVKFIAQVLDEATTRGYAKTNVARKLGLATTEQTHKTPWTDAQINLAIDAAEKIDRFGWMRCALLMGRFQAVRLGSCAVPLDCIDFERREIRYPGSVMKNGREFQQAIFPDFLPILAEIVEHRRKLGESRLCELPGKPSPSFHLRKFLDDLGLRGLSHHGLRASLITKMALKGVPESACMKFVGHQSREVHAVYQRLSSNDVVQFFDRLK